MYTACKFSMRSAVHVRMFRDNASVMLRIQDQGRGFPESVLARLRKPSAELDEERPQGALSMGLTACKRVCETLECELTFSNADESAKRKGGVMQLRIPCERNSIVGVEMPTDA